mgnify:CR=1 FL=1
METFGHHVNTQKGREILRTFGDLLNMDHSKTDTEFQIKSTRIRVPDQKDSEGRIRRPYLDMNVEITGMVVENEGIDTVRFAKDDRVNMRYRYELDDYELQELIARGMYRDRGFERDLAKALYNQPFVETTTSKVYSAKLNYDGVAVPYILLDNFETLPVDYADSRNAGGNRKGFGIALDEAMLSIDKADQLIQTNNALGRNFGFEDDEYESTRSVALEQVLDHDDFAKEFEQDVVDEVAIDEVEPDEVLDVESEVEDRIISHDVEALSSTLELPGEASSSEEQIVVAKEPEVKKKTLKERQAELAKEENVSRETESEKEDDFGFGDF